MKTIVDTMIALAIIASTVFTVAVLTFGPIVLLSLLFVGLLG